MRRTGYILAFDLLLLALFVLGIFRVSQKATLPVSFANSEKGVVVEKTLPDNDHSLKAGDIILSIGNQVVRSRDEVEFFCSGYRTGTTLPVTIQRDGNSYEVPVTIIAEHSASFNIIETLAGLVFFVIAVFVVLKQKNDKTAISFHDLSVSIAGLILLTSGCFIVSPYGVGYVLEICFQLCYTLVPLFFIRFSLIFPQDKSGGIRRILLPLTGIALMINIWSGISFMRASYPQIRLDQYQSYLASLNAIRIFFTFVFIIGLGIIIHSYRISKEEFERRKLRWVFIGIGFGICSSLFLWQIPLVIQGHGLIEEEYVLLVSVCAPVMFAIAIVKYRIFDIDLLIERSTIYAIVIGALLVVYLGIVAVLSKIARSYAISPSVADVLGALIIALLFEPLLKRVHKFVDKKFFRISYDFYEAQRSILEDIKFVTSEENLSALVVRKMNEILPVARIGFFLVEKPQHALHLAAHNGFALLERRRVKLEVEELKTDLGMPLGLLHKIEHGVRFEQADAEVFNRWGIALVLPMLSEERTALGFLVLGEKRSGTRFTIEDVALATSVSVQSGLALERIRLERQLILEQEVSERLAELNKLKSYFVSSVSHDLRTPLTSIRMFAELLQEQENLPRPKVNEYLGIIEGEADRLSRLIANVLDFAKIEKGTKEYSFKEVDLNALAADVIHSLDYQLRLGGFTLSTEFHPSALCVLIDRDAIFDAITNLITNAMKYSLPERKNITIGTSLSDGNAHLLVTDEGCGIPEEEIGRIFDPFYRVNGAHTKAVGGAGLGLSLVKHTMDAHRGSVEVRSKAGEGCIFVLHFLFNPHEEDSHH